MAQVTSAQYQQLLTTSFPQPVAAYLPPQQSQPAQDYTLYGLSSILPSQMSAPEPNYVLDQTHLMASHKPSQMSHVSTVSPHHGSPYQSPGTGTYQTHPNTTQSRKRSFQEDYSVYDYQGHQHNIHSNRSNSQVGIELGHHAHELPIPSSAALHHHYQQYTSQRASPLNSHSGRSSSMASHSFQQQQQQQQQQAQQAQQTQHHHHRLPNQQPPQKLARLVGGTFESLSPRRDDDDDRGPPSVVGQPGMPAPAPRPKGPKLKFTPEDDALLVQLKETKRLTWKQIADFFPGRSSGTLQVRYCTKLKAKTTVWTDEMVQRLRSALHEYETDRWRIVSGKVGNGFSAAACKDKALELEEDEEVARLQRQMGPDDDESVVRASSLRPEDARA